jgi:hypothetical protein
MSEHEKALVRAALMWHAVFTSTAGAYQHVADQALARACQRLLKHHPKRTYRRSRHG